MELGSFAAVARKRDLDPSSVSRTVARLEGELGFRLFQRNRRKLAATEAGGTYYTQVKGLIDDLERAGQEALDLVTQPKGTLRVAACTSFGQRVLTPLLPRLMETYPQLSVDLVLSDDKVDLIAGNIDIAIRFGSKPTGDVSVTKLVDRTFRVCASPAYLARFGALAHPRELENRDSVLFPLAGYRTAWRFRRDGEPPFDVPVRGRLLVSHGLTMTACALEGLGPTLLPDWLCSREIANGSLMDLFPGFDCTPTEFGTAAWLVHPSRSYVPNKIRAFIEFLQAGVHAFL